MSLTRLTGVAVVAAAPSSQLIHYLFVCCSLSEAELWDYVITNETMEGTGKQLADIAGRALAGQIGNGIAELQDHDVSQTLTNQTVCLLIN